MVVVTINNTNCPECGSNNIGVRSGQNVCFSCGLVLKRQEILEPSYNAIKGKEFINKHQINLLQNKSKIVTKIISLKKYEYNVRVYACQLYRELKKNGWFKNKENKLVGILSMYITLKKNEIPFSLKGLFSIFGKEYSKSLILKYLYASKRLGFYSYSYQKPMAFLQRILSSDVLDLEQSEKQCLFGEVFNGLKRLGIKKFSKSQIHLIASLLYMYSDKTGHEIRKTIKREWDKDVGTKFYSNNQKIFDFFLNFERYKIEESEEYKIKEPMEIELD